MRKIHVGFSKILDYYRVWCSPIGYGQNHHLQVFLGEAGYHRSKGIEDSLNMRTKTNVPDPQMPTKSPNWRNHPFEGLVGFGSIKFPFSKNSVLGDHADFRTQTWNADFHKPLGCPKGRLISTQKARPKATVFFFRYYIVGLFYPYMTFCYYKTLFQPE